MEVRDVWKRYDDKEALRGITFSVSKGEAFVIVGPSGAGKTTLLRILNLLDEPTRGKIYLDGVDTACPPGMRLALRRRMGMVFQQPIMFNTTVYENLAYGLKVRNLEGKFIDERVMSTLEKVRLSGYERRKGLTLSGGEMQRVALARAMAIEPELLLLDEPTADLDPANIAIMEGIVSRLSDERKTTMITATHDMFQAQRLADRVALILEGEIVEVGSAEDFFNRPKDQRTEAFIRGKITH